MRKCTNVGILAKVTAQYFFYKVYFMYLLYILCIGLCDCYWNNAEEMFMCVIPLTCWPYWNRHRQNLDFLLQHRTLQMQECDFAVDRLCQWDRKQTLECFTALMKSNRVNMTVTECRRRIYFKESWISSSYYKRYEECITLSGLTLVACDNIVNSKQYVCFYFACT